MHYLIAVDLSIFDAYVRWTLHQSVDTIIAIDKQNRL